MNSYMVMTLLNQWLIYIRKLIYRKHLLYLTHVFDTVELKYCSGDPTLKGMSAYIVAIKKQGVICMHNPNPKK